MHARGAEEVAGAADYVERGGGLVGGDDGGGVCVG